MTSKFCKKNVRSQVSTTTTNFYQAIENFVAIDTTLPGRKPRGWSVFWLLSSAISSVVLIQLCTFSSWTYMKFLFAASTVTYNIMQELHALSNNSVTVKYLNSGDWNLIFQSKNIVSVDTYAEDLKSISFLKFTHSWNFCLSENIWQFNYCAMGGLRSLVFDEVTHVDL